MSKYRSEQLPGRREMTDPVAKARVANSTVSLKDILSGGAQPGALDGVIISSIITAAHTAKAITHTLGRTPVGFLPTFVERSGTGSALTVSPAIYFVSAANATPTTCKIAAGATSIHVRGILF